MSKGIPTQKFGYIEIKQSSKVKPRKLKSWKRRWAVLTKLSNLSSKEYVAKLDLYDNESKWKSSSADKMTFVIENVTLIRTVKSKTHPHAFEIVESQPVLVLSGANELDSYSWIFSLQQIFTPEQIETKKDCYQITISPNEHSAKWSLVGDYSMTVSSSCISLGSSEGTCVISWGLSTLMKFNVKENPDKEQMSTLIIECGPNAPTGQSCFHFLSYEAQDILGAIKQSICLALALKQNTRNVEITRNRAMSATASEKGFQKLLDNYSAPRSIPTKDRSDSCSSNSTVNIESLTNVSRLSCSPTPSMITGNFSIDTSSLVETKEGVHAGDVELIGSENGQTFYLKRSSSQPDTNIKAGYGYSEIKDSETNKKFVSRRITLGCEPHDYDIDRLRSVSAVVASLKTNSDHNFASFQSSNDDKSDLDSAISSMVLSTVNDELPKSDVQHIPGTDCTDELCPCFSRRRSSSTPDLQAYWKMHGSMNIYEELDELRASVQRLNKKQDYDTPPELPARPFSINFNNNDGHGMISTAATKDWYGNPNYVDIRDRTTNLCTCENINGARSRFDSAGGQCTACGGKISPENSKTSAVKTIINKKLSMSSFSDIDNINAIILQVQNVKRRRSSDITPVASSYLSSTRTDIDSDKTNSIQPQGEDPKIFQSNSGTQEYLINLQDGEANCELGITAARDTPRPPRSNPSDSLMHELGITVARDISRPPRNNPSDSLMHELGITMTRDIPRPPRSNPSDSLMHEFGITVARDIPRPPQSNPSDSLMHELGITVARDIPRPLRTNPSDSLIHFFLDEDLDFIPTIDNEFSPHSPSSRGHLTQISSSFPNVPDSTAPGLIQPSRTWTWHGQTARINTDDLDMMGIDINSNSNSPVTIPSFLSSQFSHELHK